MATPKSSEPGSEPAPVTRPRCVRGSFCVVALAFFIGAFVSDYASDNGLVARALDKVYRLRHKPAPALRAAPIRRFPHRAPPGQNHLAEATTQTAPALALARTPWPTWRGNNRRTGCSPFEGPDLRHIQWLVPTEGLVESSPAIGPDGTVYIGSHDMALYAFSPAGRERWRYKTGGLIRSSPAVAADGTIYVGSFDGNLYAIHPEGALKWMYYAGGRVLTSPAVQVDGTIYITSQNGVLHAIDSLGQPRWQVELKGDVSVASPALMDDGTIIQATYKGQLYAIATDGAVRWVSQVTQSGFRTTPAIDGRSRILIGDRDGTLFCIAADGNILWRFRAEGDFRASPAIAPDGAIVVASHDRHLYKLSPDGALLWKLDLGGPVESSPTIDSRGMIYVPVFAGAIHAVTPQGAIAWDLTWGVTATAPAIGPNRTLCLSTDYAVMTIGAPFPSILFEEQNGQRLATAENKSDAPTRVALHLWATDAAGTTTTLHEETLDLAPAQRRAVFVPNPGPATLIVASLHDPITGELWSEDRAYPDAPTP